MCRTNKEALAWYKEQKANASCIVCGIKHPALIEFHHRNPLDKFDSLSHMVSYGWNLTMLKDEMKKCDPYCKNHHALLHWDEFQNRHIQISDKMRDHEPKQAIQ